MTTSITNINVLKTHISVTRMLSCDDVVTIINELCANATGSGWPWYKVTFCKLIIDNYIALTHMWRHFHHPRDATILHSRDVSTPHQRDVTALRQRHVSSLPHVALSAAWESSATVLEHLLPGHDPDTWPWSRDLLLAQVRSGEGSGNKNTMDTQVLQTSWTCTSWLQKEQIASIGSVLYMYAYNTYIYTFLESSCVLCTNAGRIVGYSCTITPISLQWKQHINRNSHDNNSCSIHVHVHRACT